VKLDSLVFGLAAAMLLSPTLRADGTEALGSPLGLTIAEGTGFVQAGTGLHDQPGSIVVDVPGGAKVKQVLLYWEHQHLEGQADDTVRVNGQEVKGALIGGPKLFFKFTDGSHYISSFRKDITSLGLVKPGRNLLVIDQLRSQFETTPSDGAGVVVIYDQSHLVRWSMRNHWWRYRFWRRLHSWRWRSSLAKPSKVWANDGMDAAYSGFSGELKVTKPVTFRFEPSARSRYARLGLMVADVDRGRESKVRYWTDRNSTPVVLDNVLGSTDGNHWDSLNLDIRIPPHATELTVDLVSPPASQTELPKGPAAIIWVGAFLHLTNTPAQLISSCGLSPEYWVANTGQWQRLRPNFRVRYLFGRLPAAYQDLGNMTLLDALRQQGGASTAGWANVLVRHGIAAMLNSLHRGVRYPLNFWQIRRLVHEALVSQDNQAMERVTSMLENLNLHCSMD